MGHAANVVVVAVGLEHVGDVFGCGRSKRAAEDRLAAVDGKIGHWGAALLGLIGSTWRK